MAKAIGETIGNLWLLMLVFGAPVTIILGLFWMLTAYRAMKAIVGIRQQLEQINETLSSKMTITKSAGPLGL